MVMSNRGYEGVDPIVLLSLHLLQKPLSNKRVRQAIACTLNPDFIIQQLHQGRSRRAPGPISPDSPFFDPHIKTWPVDLEKAWRIVGRDFDMTLDCIYNRKITSISPDLAQSLLAYVFPGNVRQLENIIAAAVLAALLITLDCILKQGYCSNPCG